MSEKPCSEEALRRAYISVLTYEPEVEQPRDEEVEMHAEKCPICGGAGQILDTGTGGTNTVINYVTCHGCGGQGWVSVP